MNDDDNDRDDDIAPDEPAPEPEAGVPARPAGRTVRLGCMLLMLIGALGVFLGGSTAADPAKGRCTQARTILDDELGDLDLTDDMDADFDDVECDVVVPLTLAVRAAVLEGTTTDAPSTTVTTAGTGDGDGDGEPSDATTTTTGDTAGTEAEPGTDCDSARATLATVSDVTDEQLGCPEAIAVAAILGGDPDEDDEPEFAEPATESTIRTFGYVLVAIGIVQVVGALLTLRTQEKRFRVVALAGAAIGIIFSPLGLLGIPVLGFVVYAIFFSADARAVFGEPGSPRFLRPRPPAGGAAAE